MEQRTKLTVKEIKLDKTGASVKGLFQEVKNTEFTNPQTGEVKSQPNVYLVEKETGARLKVFGNAGLKSAIEDSGLNRGDFIEIIKLDKKQLSGGKTKNQYDIYLLS